MFVCLNNSVLHFGLNENGPLVIIFIETKIEMSCILDILLSSIQPIHTSKNKLDLLRFYFCFLRRKNYILCGKSYENIDSNDKQNHIDSVDHVEIQEEAAIINCVKYFPNVTQLTLCCLNRDQNFLSTALIRIMSLRQLTKLVIDYDHDLSHVIKLLCHTPSIHTFTINRVPFHEEDIVSIEQITEYTMTDENFFVNHCPQLQHIIIKNYKFTLVPILRFLLSKDNDKTRHLHSICIHGIERDLVAIKALLQFDKSFDVSSLRVGELTLSRIFLWW
jgi:hypothetical protein